MEIDDKENTNTSPPNSTVEPQNGDAAKTVKEDVDSDEYEISEESRLFREKQEKAKQDFLMKQRGAALAVPTNDKAVRSRLRRLGEPEKGAGRRSYCWKEKAWVCVREGDFIKMKAVGSFPKPRKRGNKRLQVVEDNDSDGASCCSGGGGQVSASFSVLLNCSCLVTVRGRNQL